MSKGHSRAKKARKRDPVLVWAKRLCHAFGVPVDDRVRAVAKELLMEGAFDAAGIPSFLVPRRHGMEGGVR